MIFICSSVAAVAIDTNGDECSRGLTDQLCNPRSGVFVAESQDGIAFSSARVDEVEYGGQHAFNVLQFNESAGVDKAPYFVQRQSDGNKLVTRDPFDPDPSRRYKIVGSERAPSALSAVCLLFDAALLLTDFQLNDDIIPTSNSGVAGFDAAGFAPFANMSWKVRCTV